MAFSTLERSRFAGKPFQLYRFLRTSGDTDFLWHYTGTERDLWFQGNTYFATAIADEGIRLTGEAAAAEFKITLPSTTQFCDDFRAAGSSPSDSIYCHVYRAHADDIVGLDTTAPYIDNGILVWAGTVDGLTQTNDVEVQITCSMLAASFQREGVRYSWMKNCPHALYAPYTCKVDREAYRVDATVDQAYGNTVVAGEFTSQPDGWFTGGFVEYLLPSGFLERRMITRHLGQTIRTLGPVAGVVAGDAVSAFAGCKRTVRVCIDKFNNLPNYGGFPHIPGRNPYDGNPVF